MEVMWSTLLSVSELIMSMSVPGCRCACGLLRGGVIRRRREATTTTAIYQTYSPPASRSRRWRSNLWLPGILSGILSGMLPGMLPCLLPQHCKHHTNEGSRRDEDRIFPLILVEEHRAAEGGGRISWWATGAAKRDSQHMGDANLGSMLGSRRDHVEIT